MAGVGFELRKMLKRDSLLGLLRAYTYAGIISSGPWILSIVGILLTGTLSLPFVALGSLITQFQVSVTYLIAVNLILTGPLQLAFTRFTSDRLFEERDDPILLNYHAVSLVMTLVAGGLGLLVIVFTFSQQSAIYRLLMLTGFVIMTNVWIAVIFLSDMKQYKAIVWIFLVGYTLTMLLALLFSRLGLEGLLLGFMTGQLFLLIGMAALICRNFNGRRFLSFEVFDKRFTYLSLMLIGLLYNLGIWLDKFMFWYTPGTGQQVTGPLNASVIYDTPVFLAYLGIVPDMIVFLVRIETDFVEHYDAFYNAVRDGTPLEHIEDMRNTMVQIIRAGLYEIVKVQAMAALVLFAVGVAVLRALQISELYLPLLYVDTTTVSLQAVFLGVVNVFFYLDRRRVVLALTVVFVALSGVLTWITLWLGPAWYGYGFAVSLLLVVMASLVIPDRKLNRPECETFMLQ